MPKVTDEHRASRREQIVQAGVRCVVREGFHKTTMADVIGEAGLSAGAVYGYFRSKTELIRAIADFALGEAAHLLHDLAVRPEPVAPVDALAVMLGYVDSLARQPDGDFTKVAVQVWAEAARDDEMHRIAQERMGMLRRGMAEVLRRAQADGNLAVDAEPDEVAKTLFAVVPGYIVQRLLMRDVSPELLLSGYRHLAAGRGG